MIQKLVCEELKEKLKVKEITTKELLAELGLHEKLYTVISAEEKKVVPLDTKIDLESANTLVIIPKMAGG